MNEKFDIWLIGYRRNDRWETITLPMSLPIETIEKVMVELNKIYDIIYSKVEEGIVKKERIKVKKGEFVSL